MAVTTDTVDREMGEIYWDLFECILRMNDWEVINIMSVLHIDIMSYNNLDI